MRYRGTSDDNKHGTVSIEPINGSISNMCLIACTKQKKTTNPNAKFYKFYNKQHLFGWHIVRYCIKTKQINVTSVKCVQKVTCKRDPPNKQTKKTNKQNQSQYLGLVGRSTFLFYVKTNSSSLIARGSVVAE